MERFGFHRVLDERQATTPQAAERLDASLPARETELVVDVELLNLDSTSASQLHEEATKRGVPVATLVMETVARRGMYRTGFFLAAFSDRSLRQAAQPRDQQRWRAAGSRAVVRQSAGENFFLRDSRGAAVFADRHPAVAGECVAGQRAPGKAKQTNKKN
jgi:hypothetical protein